MSTDEKRYVDETAISEGVWAQDFNDDTLKTSRSKGDYEKQHTSEEEKTKDEAESPRGRGLRRDEGNQRTSRKQQYPSPQAEMQPCPKGGSKAEGVSGGRHEQEEQRRNGIKSRTRIGRPRGPKTREESEDTNEDSSRSHQGVRRLRSIASDTLGELEKSCGNQPHARTLLPEDLGKTSTLTIWGSNHSE